MALATTPHPSTPRESAPADAVACLLFRIGNRLCALPVAAVAETMRPLPVDAFADAPGGVIGVAIVRGAPLPVLALAQWFDGSAANATRFVTVKMADRQIALAVDAVVGVETIAAAALQQLPPLLGAAGARSVQALGALDAQLLLLLDAARLIDEAMAVATSIAPAEPSV